MTTLIVDLEADGLLDTITTLWQVSVIDADTGELSSYHGADLEIGLDRLETADRLVMHNGLGYDLPAITSVTGRDLPWERVVDTMVLSKLGNPERVGGHSLAAWGERLAVPIPKIEHEDWSQWSPEMEHRCNVDAEITFEVYKRLAPMLDLMPEAVAIEHCVAHEVMKTIRRGFRLDVDYTRDLLGQLLSEQEQQLAEFKTLFPPILVPASKTKPVRNLKNVHRRHALYGALDPGTDYCPVKVEEFNPESRQQIAYRLQKKYGWRPTKFTPAGAAEVSEDILRGLDYPEAKAFADYLVTAKLIGQINSEPRKNGAGGGWLHHIDDEGRVHASLNSLKAVTGRLSCSSPNIQQVSTDERMRRAWVPSEGRVLVGVDAEGLELRCLAHYLWPLDDGAYGRMLLEGRKEDGTDVHSVVRDLLGFYDRNQTKRAEYGWLYGAGDAKLGLIAYQDAYSAGADIRYDVLGITPGRKRPANSVVGKAMRARLEEGITGLGTLVGGIRNKAKATGKLKGLDGRPLWVRSDHSALNLLLQSAGIIIVKKAWTLICPELSTHGLVEDVDYAVVMQVHDEFQIEARPEAADAVGETVAHCIVKAGKQLGFRCPLAGSFDIGSSWAETH